MGMHASADIFQAKMDNLHGGIDCVKTYIYYILVLVKDNFPKLIDQIIVIFARLCNYGLKVNTIMQFLVILDYLHRLNNHSGRDQT